MGVIKFTDEYKAELLKRFFEYIDETDNPIMAEFCYRNDIYYQLLQKFASMEGKIETDREVDTFTFGCAIKKLAAKSETYLLRMLDAEEVRNPAGAIFRLKAVHNYRDSEPAPAPTTVNVNVTDLAKKEDDELESLISGKIAPKPSGKHAKSSAN